MNFKVRQFLQYVHLEPIRIGVIRMKENLRQKRNINPYLFFCRKLHFVWFGKKIPEKYVNNILTFRRNNPYYEVKNKKVCKENNKSNKYHNNTFNGKRHENLSIFLCTKSKMFTFYIEFGKKTGTKF